MGNPISACMSYNFLKQSQSSSANGKKCFISVNMSPHSDFFGRVKFYDWQRKELTFLACHTLNTDGLLE